MKKINTTFAAIIFAITITFVSGLNAFASGPGNDNFANAETFSEMQIHISRTNVGATKETGEPNHAGVTGGKSVWFKWTAPMTRAMAFTTNRSATNIATLLAVYHGTLLNNLVIDCSSEAISAPANQHSFCRMMATQGVTYYIAIDGSTVGNQPAAEGTFKLDIQPSFEFQGADYDSDGMTDLSVFRPSTGTWYTLNSSIQTQVSTLWGTNGDIPVPFSNSNSGRNERTVYRPSDGTWYSTVSGVGAYLAWGAAGDIPVPANFLASPGTSAAVWRPSTGTWYIHIFTNLIYYYQLGQQGDIPIAGQFGADGYADIAVFRPSNGNWYFINRTGNNQNDTSSMVHFGQQGDKPVPADYDGDGILDIAVYRPSTGVWYVLNSSNGQINNVKWGIAEDIPTTGDFDGDGVFDFAVFRPSNGNWYINRSSDNSVQITHFGTNGDIPVTANRTF